MPTITASPSLVSQATNASTAIFPPTTILNLLTSIFSLTFNAGGGGSTAAYNVLFKNALGATLVTTSMAGFTRTLATNGYAVFSNMQAVTPGASGTIAYIEIVSQVVSHYTGSSYVTGLTGPYTMTLTVGDIGSGADVEIDDLDVVSNQPWRMNGSIRWRAPNVFNYSE